MKFKLLLIAILVMAFSIVNARGIEPANNIGKNYSELKQKFPNLHYIRTGEKGDFYSDGEDASGGMCGFFYLKNNRVVEESLVVQTTDGFAKMFYDSLLEKFSKYLGVAGFACGVNHMCFSTFTTHIMFFNENGSFTTMLVYQAGGYETGVTGRDFFNKWSK